MDNKDLNSKQDRIRVNKNEPYEVAYIREQFPNLAPEVIMQAIEEAGPMRDDIMELLRSKKPK